MRHPHQEALSSHTQTDKSYEIPESLPGSSLPRGKAVLTISKLSAIFTRGYWRPFDRITSRWPPRMERSTPPGLLHSDTSDTTTGGTTPSLLLPHSCFFSGSSLDTERRIEKRVRRPLRHHSRPCCLVSTSSTPPMVQTQCHHSNHRLLLHRYYTTF